MTDKTLRENFPTIPYGQRYELLQIIQANRKEQPTSVTQLSCTPGPSSSQNHDSNDIAFLHDSDLVMTIFCCSLLKHLKFAVFNNYFYIVIQLSGIEVVGYVDVANNFALREAPNNSDILEVAPCISASFLKKRKRSVSKPETSTKQVNHNDVVCYILPLNLFVKNF